MPTCPDPVGAAVAAVERKAERAQMLQLIENELAKRKAAWLIRAAPKSRLWVPK